MNTLYVLTKWLRNLHKPGEKLPPGAEVLVRRKCTSCKGLGITTRFVCSECKRRYTDLVTIDGLLPCGHVIQEVMDEEFKCGVVGCDEGHHYYWVSLSQLAHDLPKVKDVVS